MKTLSISCYSGQKPEKTSFLNVLEQNKNMYFFRKNIFEHPQKNDFRYKKNQKNHAKQKRVVTFYLKNIFNSFFQHNNGNVKYNISKKRFFQRKILYVVKTRFFKNHGKKSDFFGTKNHFFRGGQKYFSEKMMFFVFAPKRSKMMSFPNFDHCNMI